MVEGIDVIVPVVNRDLATMLMCSIEANSVSPKRVVIIDNSREGFDFRSDTFEVRRYWDNGRMRKVNESWTLGFQKVRKEALGVCVLNDDVVLNDRFFEKIETLLYASGLTAVVCPRTTNDFEDLAIFKPSTMCQATTMSRREGWAWTIRKSVLDKVPPIPPTLQTFCGDDWIWHHTKGLGFYWVKDQSNLIYHAEGATVKGLPDRLRPERDLEKREFNYLMGENLLK